MILTDSLYAVLLQLTCVEAMIKGYRINVYISLMRQPSFLLKAAPPIGMPPSSVSPFDIRQTKFLKFFIGFLKDNGSERK